LESKSSSITGLLSGVQTGGLGEVGREAKAELEAAVSSLSEPAAPRHGRRLPFPLAQRAQNKLTVTGHTRLRSRAQSRERDEQ
jgi:hypothetical protein